MHERKQISIKDLGIKEYSLPVKSFFKFEGDQGAPELLRFAIELFPFPVK